MKNLKNILFGGILIIAPFTFTKAQNANEGLSMHALTAAFKLKAGEPTNALSMQSKAGLKAMKDIAARFTNTSNINWFAGNNIFSASVIEGGIKNLVLYDKNGGWLRTIKSYDETRMPANIRELVKRSKYFDSDILYVWEVQERNFLYYVIHLQDKKTVNEIVVYDGEITLWKTYTNQ